MDPCGMDVKTLALKIRHGDFSPQEVLAATLDKIERKNSQLGAFLDLERDEAMERAKDLEKVPPNERGCLHGVPIAIKDNILVQGQPARCASQILQGFHAPYSATAVKKLLAAGAIPLGRTNMDEFAMGSSTEHSSFFPTKNPWDLKRVPGGSSGGSAAAVSARLVPAALGSDTGGSIRQPASLCGVTGLKPTYGRISRYGLIAFGSSLDQIGPITRTAYDSALLLSVMAGPDPHDSTCRPEEVSPRLKNLEGRAKGLRLGLPKEYFTAGVEAGVARSVNDAIRVFKELGAQTVELDLPLTKYVIPVYYLVADSEAASNLSRFDGVHYGRRQGGEKGLRSLYETSRNLGFGPEVKRRILLGTFCLSSGYYDDWYKKAAQVRALIIKEFAAAFQKVDLIVGPTTPHTAFRLEEKIADPIQMYQCDILTVAANLAGLPALSIPCGPAEGLPVGLQLLAPTLEEERALALAAAYQEVTDHHKKEPTL